MMRRSLQQSATNSMAGATCFGSGAGGSFLGFAALQTQAGAPSHEFIRTLQQGHPHPALSRSTFGEAQALSEGVKKLTSVIICPTTSS
jgi:hypothetical protein